MKTLTSLTLGTLAASLLTLNVASAATLSDDAIFSAIDGEYATESTDRVNFSMSAGDSSALDLEYVLKGIDGEYGHAGIMSQTRAHGSVAELPKIFD